VQPARAILQPPERDVLQPAGAQEFEDLGVGLDRVIRSAQQRKSVRTVRVGQRHQPQGGFDERKPSPLHPDRLDEADVLEILEGCHEGALPDLPVDMDVEGRPVAPERADDPPEHGGFAVCQNEIGLLHVALPCCRRRT
jgi:hypothetical protein